jgi:GWxTD domain-containing protein
MKRAAALAILSLATSLALADSVPDLFTKVKEQVKAEKWSDALVTLEALSVEAARPENEKYRSQLEAPTAFYRAVCEANVGQADKAQADFETFLRAQPNTALDEKMYSKKAMTAFQAAQKAIASQGPSLSRAYAEFKAPPPEKDLPSAAWGEGPVRWLMTDAEKSAWAAAKTDDDRAAFIEKFWKVRVLEDDPSFRTTFDKRVAFADVNFKQGETRGSLSDRGMVFVLLGPPTYGGRKPLRAGDDANDPSGMSSRNKMEDTVAMHQLTGNRAPSGQVAALADQQGGPGATAPESNMNYQEVWHYRKDLLPKGVSYIQVDAVFLTKKGYGQNVLQRESDILTTLSAAKQKPS